MTTSPVLPAVRGPALISSAVIDLVADITQEIGHLAVVLDRAAGDVAVKQLFQVTLEADNVEHAGLPNWGLPPAG